MTNRNNNYIEHGGIRGMKWGFHDGRRNGKRTARAKDYNNRWSESMNYATRQIIDSKYSKNNELRKLHDERANRAINNAKRWGDAARDASGVGYDLGYHAGQAVRQAPKVASSFSRSVSKGAKEVSKVANRTYSSISKTASSGLSWLKKHIF